VFHWLKDACCKPFVSTDSEEIIGKSAQKGLHYECQPPLNQHCKQDASGTYLVVDDDVDKIKQRNVYHCHAWRRLTYRNVQDG
jgi:hypothetical protein